MTFNQYAYDIWEAMRATLVDDDSVDLRQVKFWLNTQRALFLRNEYNKDNRNIDPHVLQSFCMELEHADSSECCNIGSGCTVVRTVNELPVPIELYQGDMLTYVGPIGKFRSTYLRTNRNMAPFVNNGRFNRNIVHWLLHNHRIYLIFHQQNMEVKLLKYISVSGVFEDPEQLRELLDCPGGTHCYTDETEYPIGAWMYPYLKSAVLQLHVQPEMVTSTDKANDAAADTQPTVTK